MDPAGLLEQMKGSRYLASPVLEQHLLGLVKQQTLQKYADSVLLKESKEELFSLFN